MARRNTSKADEATASEEAVTEADTTEEPTNGTTETSSPEGEGSKPEAVELTDEQLAEAIKPFLEAVSAAVAERDESTGSVPEGQIEAVNAAYSALDGVKVKNAAKRRLNELMKDAMNEMDIILARAHMEINEKLAATGAKKTSKVREPKAPVDPTEAYVERVTVLNLAYNLATEDGAAPEGVKEGYLDDVAEAISNVDADQVTAYRDWLRSDAEDKGEAPEVSAVVVSAVKLAEGKSAKPGKAPKRASGGGESTYDGPRRDIAKHIAEAFEAQPSGTFLKVAEIRKFKSSEYGDDSPSAGAINARLFPNSGKCTLVGVVPGTNEGGDKGGTKA